MGAGESKNTPKKTENSDKGVQSLGQNSKTNQDFKNRKYNNLTSPINSKVNDIKVTLKVFDLHLHRLASLHNSINFSDVNLYNSQTFELISLHLEVFCSAHQILSSLKILLTVYRRRFFLRNVFLPCSQMGTPAGLRSNKQYNLDTFFL